MTKRIRTWQSALDALVFARLTRPFGWGQQDCALWSADCMLAVTGEDPAADLRGTYSSAAGAAEVLDRLGGLGQIASDRCGQAIELGLMQVADIVLTNLEGRDTLAVCMGTHLIAPGAEGLVSIPLTHAISAWRCTKD